MEFIVLWSLLLKATAAGVAVLVVAYCGFKVINYMDRETGFEWRTENDKDGIADTIEKEPMACAIYFGLRYAGTMLALGIAVGLALS